MMSTHGQPLLTWLHLSDLHFGHGPTEHGWDQVMVLNTLRRTVEEACGTGEWPKIDLVLITGDIAFSGGGKKRKARDDKDEYQEAAEWLNEVASAAEVEPGAVFMVPGNHDVDRSRDEKSPDTRRLVEVLRDAKSKESIDDALGRSGDRRKLQVRQKRYLEFAKAWAKPCQAGKLFWTHPAPAASGLRYRLVGMNTALLCKDDEDRGKLAAGKEQLARLLVKEPIASDELVIMLSHHPLNQGWLADEKGIWDHVRARAHLHLCGHLHEAHSSWVQTGAGDEIVTVVAGAAHAEAKQEGSEPATHGFNLASIVRCNDGKLAVEIHPWRWSKSRFVLDVDTLPKGCDRATHRLRPIFEPEPDTAGEDSDQPKGEEGTLRQAIREDLQRIFAGDQALADCFAAEYGTNTPEALADALSSAPLAESLGRFFSVYDAPDRRTRLQSSSGFREVIAVILRLATQWETVCRWHKGHAAGTARRFLLKPFQKSYVAQVTSRLIQGNRRLGLVRGRTAPGAPDVVEVGLDPGTDREYAQAELESVLWERAMGSRLETYDPHDHRQELWGNLRALAGQKRGLVVLVDEDRPVVRPDVAEAIPSILLFERCQNGEVCFMIDEFELGRLLNDILHQTGG